jgi:plasmid stability protein
MGRRGSKRGVLIYMPDELHRWLKAKAALEGRSLSAVIEDAARGVYPDAPGGEEAPGVAEKPATYQRARRRSAAPKES